MRIVVTGGHGFIGTLLWQELAQRGVFDGRSIDEIVLVDRVTRTVGQPPGVGMTRIDSVGGDLLDVVDGVFDEPVDVLFHLAAAVSSECEADFDLGMRANVDATRALLSAARAQHEGGGPTVRFVFSSSVAVYGPDPVLPLPPVVSESTLPTPQSSYGAEKLVGEQLIAEHTRRGLLDGRVARLMTVCVRPGAPNAAASSFVSGVLREPLSGVEAVCPVRPDLPLAIASPATTIAGLLALAEAARGDAPGQLSGRLPVNLPALTVTVQEMLDALARHGGPEARSLVRMQEDPRIDAIVRSWPSRFDNTRALALGLEPDPSIDAIVEQYLATTTR